MEGGGRRVESGGRREPKKKSGLISTIGPAPHNQVESNHLIHMHYVYELQPARAGLSGFQLFLNPSKFPIGLGLFSLVAA